MFDFMGGAHLGAEGPVSWAEECCDGVWADMVAAASAHPRVLLRSDLVAAANQYVLDMAHFPLLRLIYIFKHCEGEHSLRAKSLSSVTSPVLQKYSCPELQLLVLRFSTRQMRLPHPAESYFPTLFNTSENSSAQETGPSAPRCAPPMKSNISICLSSHDPSSLCWVLIT